MKVVRNSQSGRTRIESWMEEIYEGMLVLTWFDKAKKVSIDWFLGAYC